MTLLGLLIVVIMLVIGLYVASCCPPPISSSSTQSAPSLSFTLLEATGLLGTGALSRRI